MDDTVAVKLKGKEFKDDPKYHNRQSRKEFETFTMERQQSTMGGMMMTKGFQTSATFLTIDVPPLEAEAMKLKMGTKPRNSKSQLRALPSIRNNYKDLSILIDESGGGKIQS